MLLILKNLTAYNACVDADPEFLRCDSGQLTFSTALTFHTDNGQSVNVTQYEQLSSCSFTYSYFNFLVLVVVIVSFDFLVRVIVIVLTVIRHPNG